MQDKPMAACPDWALIKNKYLAGAGLRSLARKAGIPEGTILSRAKREGWKAAKRWRLCPWCGCKFKECDPSCGYRRMVSHIEKQFSKGMTWENYGVFGWHLDHIIPCERFDLTNEDHCRVCFNWRNIRPLWGEDNCNRQEMLTLDEALQLDPALLEMTSNVGVKLW